MTTDQVVKETGVNLALIFVGLGLPEPETEVRFHPKRRWKFDYCWQEFRVALEREGSLIVKGRRVSRHTSIKGYGEDCSKYSEAAIAGWCVIRVTPPMIKSGEAFDLVERALVARGFRKTSSKT